MPTPKQQTETKKKPGRKPQWTDAKVEQMCKAIATGKSYKDAYTAARVSHTTFYKHFNEDVEFNAKIKKAELIRGYEWDETTTESALDKNGKMVEVKKKIVHKKAAPNPTAIIFALCNRAPGEWSNKHIQELTGKIETETKPGITLANVPDNLLAQVIDAINGK